MNMLSIIDSLESEWDLESGFLGKLRMGIFEKNDLERFISILKSIAVDDNAMLNRRFVSLTWYIPLFMTWQRERIREKGNNEKEFDVAINEITGLIEKILGIP